MNNNNGKGKKTASTHKELVTIRKLKVESQVRRMLVDCVSYSEIRSTLKLSIKSFNAYKERVCRRWAESEAVDAKTALRRRIAQLENNAHKANVAYEDSKEDGEEVITRIEEKKCTRCLGKKKNRNGVVCGLCGGTGEESIKHITHKRRGKVGNPAFLREHRQCIEMMAKLEGLVAAQKVEHSIHGQISHSHHKAISDENQFKDASPEQILKLKEAIADIEEVPALGTNNDIINVEVLKVATDEEKGDEG